MLQRLFSTARAVFILGAVAATLPAHADQLADIQRKGELVVGVLGSDEPNSFVDPATREIVGYEVDIARAIAQKLNVKLTIKQLAVAARIPELQQRRVDLLAASLTHTKEREQVIDFSLTTFVTGQKVLVRKSSNISQVSQLAGQKVVAIKGGTQEPNIRKAVPNVDVVTFETGPQALQALQQGKGAGFVNDEASLLDAYAKLGPAQKDYVILSQNLSVEPLAIGVPKGEKSLKVAVDDTLRQLEASGEAEKLFVKWYGPATRLKFPSRSFKIESDQVEGAEARDPAMPMNRFDLQAVLQAPFTDWLFQGFALSLALTFVTLLLALPLGAAWALMRVSHRAGARGLAGACVEGIRSTPLLVHFLFWYFGVTPLLPDASREWLYGFGAETVCAVIGLTLYTAAYMAEDLRSGLRAVPAAQSQAALALGLSRLATLRFVVLPQAVRISVPPLISQTLNLWKNTSIATVIGASELMYQAQRVESASFRGAETFAVATVAYLCVSLLLTAASAAWHHRHPAAA